MFGSVALEVAIGLVFVYVLLSLICSAVREGIEARLKSRAIHLERGIREMLREADDRTDGAGSGKVAAGAGAPAGLTEALYDHPLISSLFRGNYARPVERRDFGGLRWIPATVQSWTSDAGTELPSYVPARNFALALLDIAGRDPAAGEAGDGSGDEPLSVDLIRRNVSQHIRNPLVQRVVISALDNSRGNIEVAIANVQAWYDSTMDRVSGWYKRETQHIVFWLGLIVAVLLNVDTIALVRHLATSEQARVALVAQAASAVRDGSLRDAAVAPMKAASEPAASTADPTAGSLASPPPSGVAGTGASPHASASVSQGAGAAPSSATSARSASSTAAGAAGNDNPDAQVRALRAQLDSLGLPIGWGDVRPASGKRTACVSGGVSIEPACDLWPYEWGLLLASLLGWLLTAFAISFGAPFWFDLLNKLMVIRSTVKPHEKSGEEASDDRQTPSSDVTRTLAQQIGTLQPMMLGLLPAALPQEGADQADRAAPDGDDLLKLKLSTIALRAARELRRRHPRVVFTSGRRSKEEQARAMATNVVKNRRWIEQTYKASPLRLLCQEWVDSHPEAVTREQITAGLIEVFDSVSEAELAQFSKHLSGDAFDVQPVTENAEAIKQSIRSLPGLVKFLDKEGGLVRWHAEFGRGEA